MPTNTHLLVVCGLLLFACSDGDFNEGSDSEGLETIDETPTPGSTEGPVSGMSPPVTGSDPEDSEQDPDPDLAPAPGSAAGGSGSEDPVEGGQADAGASEPEPEPIEPEPELDPVDTRVFANFTAQEYEGAPPLVGKHTGAGQPASTSFNIHVSGIPTHKLSGRVCPVIGEEVFECVRTYTYLTGASCSNSGSECVAEVRLGAGGRTDIVDLIKQHGITFHIQRDTTTFYSLSTPPYDTVSSASFSNEGVIIDIYHSSRLQ